MPIDIEYLNDAYFTFDEPVPYQLKCGVEIKITPVKLVDSKIFLTSYGILDIDKNSTNDVEIIQMSYLKYLSIIMLKNDIFTKQLTNICLLCLGFTFPYIRYDEKKRPVLANIIKEEDKVRENFFITAKEFDDIKKIILYQNIPTYDDSYLDPELKANMAEFDKLKAKNIEIPSLERKISIVTAHTGILKSDQMKMTLREHSMLFDEIVGEVDFMTAKPIAYYSGKANDVQWIYKNKKGKFEDYLTSVEKYNKSMGGDGSIKKTVNSSEALSSQYDKFIGG